MLTLCPLSIACAEPEGKVSAIGGEPLAHPAIATTRIRHRLNAGDLITISPVLRVLEPHSKGSITKESLLEAKRVSQQLSPGMPHTL
jgi:hypothetical protein